MISKGSYRLVYVIDKIQGELLVEVELKPIQDLIKPRQNVYYGIAVVNGIEYLKRDLSHYVNARYAAVDIGNELKQELKVNNDKFKIKKEEIK